MSQTNKNHSAHYYLTQKERKTCVKSDGTRLVRVECVENQVGKVFCVGPRENVGKSVAHHVPVDDGIGGDLLECPVDGANLLAREVRVACQLQQ